MSAGNLYAEIVAAGLEVSNHESDLYIVDTEKAREICRNLDWKFSVFTGSDSRKWLDIPFAYTPFWEKRGMS